MFIGRAPGRAEWLGNHTDYNEGLVLGIGLGVGTTVAATPRADGRLVLHAVDLGEKRERSVHDLGAFESGCWANYVIGVAAGMIARGARARGLSLEIRSTVPMGAGLSSSAALECAAARALQQAWGTDFDDMELARIGQEAEHKFAGVRCGLLDQVTSLFAAPGRAVFFDCRSLEVQKVPVPHEARFVIVQSGVKHALSDGAYNARRSECEQAASSLGVRALRDATSVSIDVAAAEGRLRGDALKRARHVAGENERVAAAVAALAAGDLSVVGRLMDASHESSRVLFENSCRELDWLCATARGTPGCLGARLTGGGFGGAILALVREGDCRAFAAALAESVQVATGRDPQILVTGAGA